MDRRGDVVEEVQDSDSVLLDQTFSPLLCSKRTVSDLPASGALTTCARSLASGALESLGSTMQSVRVELLPYLRTLHPSDNGNREAPTIPLSPSSILVAGPTPAALRASAGARH